MASRVRKRGDGVPIPSQAVSLHTGRVTDPGHNLRADIVISVAILKDHVIDPSHSLNSKHNLIFKITVVILKHNLIFTISKHNLTNLGHNIK